MKIIEKALETVKKVDLENILKEYFSSDFEIDDNDGPDVWVEDNWLSVNFEKKQAFRNWLVTRLSLILPRRFKAKTDNCSEVFEADDLEDAKEWAEDWLSEGEYGDDPCYVSASVVEIDEDDEVIGSPEDVEIEWEGHVEIPKCEHEDGHDWQEPYEVVGGCKENPGVYGIGGAQICSTSVCSRCGMYRIYNSASTTGTYPKEPEKYEYKDVDERSMKWVEGLLMEFIIISENGSNTIVKATNKEEALKMIDDLDFDGAVSAEDELGLECPQGINLLSDAGSYSDWLEAAAEKKGYTVIRF